MRSCGHFEFDEEPGRSVDIDSYTCAVGRDRRLDDRFCSRRLIPLLILTVVPLLLGGCVAPIVGEFGLSGNVILWHSWEETDALILEQILGQVSEISPDTEVISIYVPPDELLQRYIDSTLQGVGPDLLLGSSEWVRDLADAGTARPLSGVDLNRFDYHENALSALQFQGQIYGLPMSLFPVALYYNRSHTQAPPTTLEEMLEQAAAGESIALVPRFKLSHWGIQPFGHGLFDSQGRFTLDGSGLTEWLTWLERVQHEPGVILNTDGTAMEEMFRSERVTYYVDGPDELRHLEEWLAPEQIGVVPLPAGPVGPSGPLLPVEAVMLSTSSSDEQSTIALAVAHFLTNPQQSTTLMRDVGRVPANRDVAVDARVYPNLAGFSSQGRTAVTLPNYLDREAFYRAGDRAYANALSGVLTPDQSVCEFGREVISTQGLTPDQVDLPSDCEEDVSDDIR